MGSHKIELKQPKGRELLGGDLLAQCLHQLGVRVAFGLHGGHLDAFLMGCVDVGIELIDTRHETVAVRAAEGYAKVSGKTGCCFVTANSGFANALPGLATAYADRSPLFCVTSSPPLRDAETNALQGFLDQTIVAKPLTKFCHRVTNVGEIPRIVSLAWRTASTGAPGPVLVDFPIDVLFTPVDSESVAWGGVTAPISAVPGPDLSAVKTVVGMLKKAERPVVIVGTGASKAVDEIISLSEKTRVPVFHSPKFSTTFPHTHPSHAGSADTLALLPALGEKQPDFVLILGARTGFLLGGRSGAIIPNSEACTLIQVDISGAEIGRSEHISQGIVSDTRLFVSSLIIELSTNNTNDAKKFKASESWLRTALSLKTFRAPHNESEPKIDPKNGNLHPYHGVKALLQSLPASNILCLDGGEAGGWALQNLPYARASLSMICTGYLGFLGNGWGYSLGAAIADREVGSKRLVVNFQGDGSAGFHIAELDTYKKFNLPILTVIVNNSVWGMSRSGQELLYGNLTSKRPASTLNPSTRYDIVAQGFAMPGLLVDATQASPGQSAPDEERAEKVLKAIGAAVEQIVASKGPGLVDLRVSEAPVQDMTRAMVGDTEDKDVIVVPYYDNLPRPYYKKRSNQL
ncbi:thiamine diphosphate-binding protein [Byssothecium circinans]|uniref:Thiamine diphosphate-binding protein n=1 Tax=Byssothecium circinans TaxID=147558 RepID=A0A6A5UI40_9PLEO|nr:thiamine diphosphate-binding protein [Byssothecium circinans]